MIDIENPEALEGYLRKSGRIAAIESVQFEILRGGVSNRTVLIRKSIGSDWVMKQALPKLRVATDWFSEPSRIFTEAAGIRSLSKLAPRGTVPGLVFEDREEFLLAMEAVPEPHENWKTRLLSGAVNHSHIVQFATILASIHRESSKILEDLSESFEDRSFFESLRIEPYYLYAAENQPRSAPFLHDLVATTRERREALVHGDYSPKNVLVQNDRLVLLDHEVIHLGDPAFDLGFAMTHLLSKGNHLSEFRQDFAEAVTRFFSVYRTELGGVPWGEGLDRRAVEHTLGCLLARVAGRSPLEYLSDSQRERQKEAVLGLMSQPPDTVKDMVDDFYGRI